MEGHGVLLKLLRAHKELYENLSGLAEQMNDALRAGGDTSALLELMSKRDAKLDEIQENDARISEIATSGQGAKWLEQGEAASLVEELRGLVNRVMELDEEGRQALEEASKTARKDMGDLSSTRKGVAGYGLRDKRPSARFKDIKL